MKIAIIGTNGKSGVNLSKNGFKTSRSLETKSKTTT